MLFEICDKKKKELFISIFNLLKNASSQMNIMVDENILHIQGMDKSHICLFDLHLNKEWFDKYEVEKRDTFSFDTNIFFSMISTKSEEQKLIIKKNDEDTLHIELVNETEPQKKTQKKHNYNKYFTMPLLEYEYDEVNIPVSDYETEFSILSNQVNEMFSQLSNYGEDITMQCTENYIDMKTTGQNGEMLIQVPCDDLSTYAIVEDEIISLTYSLFYISKMCVTSKLTDEIEFCLSKDFPMKISYYLEVNEEKEEIGNKLIFYIAPKIEDNI